MAGEHSPFVGLQRLESAGDRVLVVGFHRHQVARDEDEIGLALYRALADLSQSLDGHECAQVGIADLDDRQRPLPWFALLAETLAKTPQRTCVVLGSQVQVDRLLAGPQRLHQARRGDHEGNPCAVGGQPERRGNSPGKREQGGGDEPAGGPAHQEPQGPRLHAGAPHQRDDLERGGHLKVGHQGPERPEVVA